MKLFSISILIILISITSCENNSFEPPQPPQKTYQTDNYTASYKIETEEGIHLPDAWVSIVECGWGSCNYYDFHPNENGVIPVIAPYSKETIVLPDSIKRHFRIYPTDTTDSPIWPDAYLPLYRGTNYPLVVVKIKYP